MILGGEREERGATISLEEEAVDKKLEAPTYFVVFFSTRIDFISVIWKVFVYRTKVPRDKVVLSLEFFFLQPYHNTLVSTNRKTISSVIYVGRVRVLTDRSNPWIS